MAGQPVAYNVCLLSSPRLNKIERPLLTALKEKGGGGHIKIYGTFSHETYELCPIHVSGATKRTAYINETPHLKTKTR